MIVSADTLVYFGLLEDVVAASANALRPGGRLIFTVEELIDAGSDAGYAISPTGRYRHTRQYLERVLASANLRPEIVPAELRLEAGDPVAGLVVRGTKSVDAPGQVVALGAAHLVPERVSLAGVDEDCRDQRPGVRRRPALLASGSTWGCRPVQLGDSGQARGRSRASLPPRTPTPRLMSKR